MLTSPALAGPTAGPTTRPAAAPDASRITPASGPAAEAPQEEEAERQDLERQKRVIEEKLAKIYARRRGTAATLPAGKPEEQARIGGNPPTPAPQVAPAPAASPSSAAAAEPAVDLFSVHGQSTVITARHDAFHAPYFGPNSLQRFEDTRTSITATLYLGVRTPWDGGAVFFDPEIAGGEGFSGVLGLANPNNGETPRVAKPTPEPYVARLYYQQVFGLGGEKEHVESDQNQIAGYRDARRITVSVGQFAADDFFDLNSYAHDPRTQFENWGLWEDTAWDYPADTHGYTQGVVVEYTQPEFALRYGAFREPRVANGEALDPKVFQALGHTLEYEQRYNVGGHPGVARLLGFVNTAHMGTYGRAISEARAAGATPDITATRAYTAKYGASLNVEQSLTDDLGVWGRIGWNDGRTESWAFTEVDRAASAGVSLKGTKWGRPDDVFGFAGLVSGISRDHRNYLRDGGLGFLIGDGRLSYAPEEVLETYYSIKLADHVLVSPDFQFINHPAYNSDRGPVFIGDVRVHIEF